MRKFLSSIFCLATLVVLILSLNSSALAGASSQILITEFQHGSGSKEVIEIENRTDSDIDLADWILQYHSSTATTWSNKVLTFTDPSLSLIAAGDRTILAASGYSFGVSPMATFSAGLADTGGAIRIVPALSLDQTLGDQLTWGQTDPPTCSVAPKHSDGQSLKRLPSGDGVLVDSAASGMDFYVSTEPSPNLIDTQDPFSIDEVADYCGKPVEPDVVDLVAPGIVEDPGAPPPPVYLPIKITELFPDPVAPQTDGEDEYIELFNPNQVAVDLSGYILETGLDYNYSYTLGSILLQPGEYYAISRKDSGLTLSNAASWARLKSPAEEVLDETEAYEDTIAAESWQLVDGNWGWSGSPSPSAANINDQNFTVGQAAAKVVAKPATKKTTTTKTTTKKAAAKKATSSAKTKKAATKTTSKTSKDKASTNTSGIKDDQSGVKLSPYLLWGLAGLVLGYGLWEYRLDLLALARRRKDRDSS